MTKTTTDTIVIYHSDCPDGFCAAWQAWRELGYGAEYKPAHYDEAPPDVRDKRVYVVDFCYPYEVTVQMIAECAQLVILDHHKTAQEDLRRLTDTETTPGKVRITFDMNRSGAGLARDYWHPEDRENWIVNYTQDRDLWRFALPDSQTVNAYLHTLPHDFKVYERVLHTVKLEEALQLGRGAQMYRDMYVAMTKRQAVRQCFAEYDDIPVVNAPYVAISDLVGELAKDALFAVGWFQRGDGQISYSLRSRGDFDVSKLAERFGGGGHKGAAGFRLRWKVPTVAAAAAAVEEQSQAVP